MLIKEYLNLRYHLAQKRRRRILLSNIIIAILPFHFIYSQTIDVGVSYGYQFAKMQEFNNTIEFTNEFIWDKIHVNRMNLLSTICLFLTIFFTLH